METEVVEPGLLAIKDVVAALEAGTPYVIPASATPVYSQLSGEFCMASSFECLPHRMRNLLISHSHERRMLASNSEDNVFCGLWALPNVTIQTGMQLKIGGSIPRLYSISEHQIGPQNSSQPILSSCSAMAASSL